MGRWKAQTWLHDVKSNYPNMHGWVQRAFYVSSYALGDEGSHWRKQIKKGLGSFDSIVADWSAAKVQIAGWEIPV